MISKGKGVGASRGGVAGRWICRVNSWKIRALFLRFVCAESFLCHLSFPSEEGCSLPGMGERKPEPSQGEVEALLLAGSGRAASAVSHLPSLQNDPSGIC